MFSLRTIRALLAPALLLSISTAMAQTGKAAPTLAEAEAFMKKAEVRLNDQNVKASRASWVPENFITDDTEILSALANEEHTKAVTTLHLHSRRFANLRTPP